MKIFQNSCRLTNNYLIRVNGIIALHKDFDSALTSFKNDLYGTNHVLESQNLDAKNIFYTNINFELLQIKWANDNSLKFKNLSDISLAQIESNRSEIFYDLDPRSSNISLLNKLPSSVKLKVLWNASPNSELVSKYDLVVNNFPGLLSKISKKSRVSYFTPSFSRHIESNRPLIERSIDILFVGSFSRHHIARNSIITNLIMQYKEKYNIQIHVETSPFTELCEQFPLNKIPFFKKFTKNNVIKTSDKGPIYGVDLYEKMKNSKIVVNVGIDFSEFEKGNLRCFETLNCGALLMSDCGIYPNGFEDNKTFLSYSDPNDMYFKINNILSNLDKYEIVRSAGYTMLKNFYNRDIVYDDFVKICGGKLR